MILTVFPEPHIPTRGRLHFGTQVFPCALGRGGVGVDKREGDGKTPVGRFALRRVLYRPDRVAPPVTGLPINAITPNDGWCDDPADPAYNRPVALPYAARTEAMWRDDHLYDVVVVLGHNDDPIIPGAGSAIFLHVTSPGFAPTEGCVALALESLLTIVAAGNPDDALIVNAAP